MRVTQVVLETDRTGMAIANLVVREPHVLTEVNSRSKRTIVPVHGPFYLNNLLLEIQWPDGSYSPLELGTDYAPVFRYRSAEIATSKEVFGGLQVQRELVEGMICLTYQALGTAWAGDRNYVLEAIASSVLNPRVATWDSISGLPEIFPPQTHQQPLEDFRGLEDLIAAVNAIGDKLAEPFNPSLLYPQIAVELLAKYEGLLRRTESLENELLELRRQLGLS